MVKAKNNNVKKSSKKVSNKSNDFKSKVLVFLGVIIFLILIVYLMNYFFVEKSYIKVNMSTDKKLEYITLEGQEELIATQKYISDLNYSMRYDIENFKVFKYKKQDLYRFLNNERVVVMVEKSALPTTCVRTALDTEYNNCYIRIDNYTEEYYISNNKETFKITVKSPNSSEYEEGVKVRIYYMLNSFNINA